MRGCEIGNRAATALVGVALLALPLTALAHPDEADSSAGAASQAASRPIELAQVQFGAGGAVSGMIVNRSADVLREVQLLVRYDWQWKNEREPGEDSPARSTYVTISGDVPALGTLPFQFAPAPPLPERDDGHFTPSIEVARYTQVRYDKVPRDPSQGRTTSDNR